MTRLARYYDWLGRFQQVAGLVSRSGDGTLTVHRRLASERPDVPPHHVVHERLLAAVGPLVDPRVLDAGCGLGGTTFFLHERLGGRYDGVTLSPVQRARAEREARRRSVSESCRFHVRSYDDDPAVLAPDGVDLVVAIESLAHSPNPARTIANLARALRAGGQLAVVDDVPDDALLDDDPDFVRFREGWRVPHLARGTALLAAFRAAGLEVERDEDLTPLVIQRDPRRRERLVAINRRVRALLGLTAAGEVVDSLDGGLMLERLYARGLMRYRLVVGRRPVGRPID